MIDGSYDTMVKSATTASFTATEDMTVAMRIRKPDKSAVTAEELANIVIYDSQFGMIGFEGIDFTKDMGRLVLPASMQKRHVPVCRNLSDS